MRKMIETALAYVQQAGQDGDVATVPLKAVEASSPQVVTGLSYNGRLETSDAIMRCKILLAYGERGQLSRADVAEHFGIGAERLTRKESLTLKQCESWVQRISAARDFLSEFKKSPEGRNWLEEWKEIRTKLESKN